MSYRKKAHTEEQSRDELASTEISPRTAKALSWCFILTIFSVPLLESSVELRKGERPTVLSFFDPLVGAGQFDSGMKRGASTSPLENLLATGHLRNFESSIENHSVLRSQVQPVVQEWLHWNLGVGNNKIVVGKDGWLFYRSGVDYLLGPSVVDPSHLWVRSKQAIDRQTNMDPSPDPRPAIQLFQKECTLRGIRLLLLPVPDKAMMQAGELSSRMKDGAGADVPNNRGYERLVTELNDSGIQVLEAWKGQTSQARLRQRYLRRDTHWLPEFMEQTAVSTAREIRKWLPNSLRSLPDMALMPERRTHFGDLLQLLRLTPEQRIYPEESVEVKRVVVGGADWQPDRQSEVLILGDSFTNIYSQKGLGWGTSAGFAEHVSFALGRPVDVIAVNGSGATGTRVELARPENRDRLQCKKVVVWQFAIRDLAVENWASVHIPGGTAACERPAALESRTTPPVQPLQPSGPQTNSPPLAGPLTILGQVVKTSSVPEPYSAPYSDCLTAVLISVENVESGQYGNKEILVLFWAMRDNKWLPGARYTVGDRLRLELIPLSKATEVRGVQRADNLEDFEHLPYFAAKEQMTR